MTQQDITGTHSSPRPFQIRNSRLKAVTRSNFFPYFILAFSILALSSTAVFIKVASRELSVEAVVFDRLLFSTIFFISWHWSQPFLRSDKDVPKEPLAEGNSASGSIKIVTQSPKKFGIDTIRSFLGEKQFLIALLVGMAIAQLAARLVFTWSLDYTTAANGTMLANMPPLFTALGGCLFLGQRFDRRFLGGLGIAMVGAIVLSLGDWLYPQEAFFGAMAIIGDLAAFMSSGFYAAGYLVIEKLRQYLSTMDILMWRCILGLVMIAPFVLWFDDVLFPTTLMGWLAILSLSLISEVIGHGLVVYILKHFSSAFVATAFLLEPFPVAVYGRFVLGEVLSIVSILGFILISIGIYIAKTGKGAESQLSANGPPKVPTKAVLNAEHS